MKRAVKPCTNNATEKAAAVARGMRDFGNYVGMEELYRRGCFRHVEDVAYARIMLEKEHESIDEIAAHLDASYKGPKLSAHRCDRVYPPS